MARLAYPARASFGTDVSGTAKRGKIPSENPISKIIPSDFSPAIVRTGRLITNSAYRHSISAFGFGRSFFMPTKMVRM